MYGLDVVEVRISFQRWSCRLCAMHDEEPPQANQHLELQVPPHRPSQRIDRGPYLFPNQEMEIQQVCKEVAVVSVWTPHPLVTCRC